METDLHAEASDETYSETINFSDSVEDDLALANLSSKWDSPVASPPPPPPMPPTDLGIRFSDLQTSRTSQTFRTDYFRTSNNCCYWNSKFKTGDWPILER